jgi:hypothetical protein
MQAPRLVHGAVLAQDVASIAKPSQQSELPCPAIQYGFPFLFEGCDEYIDPIIDPVLERSLVIGPGGKQVSTHAYR